MPRPQSLFITSCLAFFLWTNGATGQAWADEPVGVEATNLIVELADRQSEKSVRQGLQGLTATIRRVRSRGPSSYNVAGHGERSARDLRRWLVVAVPQKDAAAARKILTDNPAILNVAEEKWYKPAWLPNDALFGEQYGLHSEQAAGLSDINASGAWDKTTGSADTVIAIIDGGVDATHEDLKEKIWINGDEIADNGADDDANGFIDDVYGWDFVAGRPAEFAIDHATHVAGIAAAAGNNSVGIAGVDWGARIMSVRVLANLANEEKVAQGIIYALENGADIINLSIAGPPSEIVAGAIEEAYASGVVVVAAAGNSGRDTTNRWWYPACAEPADVNMVIGVAATSEAGEPASFSNYGDCVDVAAPGEDILSTVLRRNRDSYDTMSGTSMSAPFVTGTVGLYRSLHPNATAAEAISAIVSTRAPFAGSDLDDIAEWTARYKGKLDAAAVVGRASPSDAGVSAGTSGQPPALQPPASGEEVSGPSAASGSDGGGHSGGEEEGSGDEQAEAPIVKKPKVAGAISQGANLSLLKRTKLTFKYVYGRYPTVGERAYWDARIKKGEKKTYEALLGAMQWQKARKVKSVASRRNALYYT